MTSRGAPSSRPAPEGKGVVQHLDAYHPIGDDGLKPSGYLSLHLGCLTLSSTGSVPPKSRQDEMQKDTPAKDGKGSKQVVVEEREFERSNYDSKPSESSEILFGQFSQDTKFERWHAREKALPFNKRKSCYIYTCEQVKTTEKGVHEKEVTKEEQVIEEGKESKPQSPAIPVSAITILSSEACDIVVPMKDGAEQRPNIDLEKLPAEHHGEEPRPEIDLEKIPEGGEEPEPYNSPLGKVPEGGELQIPEIDLDLIPVGGDIRKPIIIYDEEDEKCPLRIFGEIVITYAAINSHGDDAETTNTEAPIGEMVKVNVTPNTNAADAKGSDVEAPFGEGTKQYPPPLAFGETDMATAATTPHSSDDERTVVKALIEFGRGSEQHRPSEFGEFAKANAPGNDKGRQQHPPMAFGETIEANAAPATTFGTDETLEARAASDLLSIMALCSTADLRGHAAPYEASPGVDFGVSRDPNPSLEIGWKPVARRRTTNNRRRRRGAAIRIAPSNGKAAATNINVEDAADNCDDLYSKVKRRRGFMKPEIDRCSKVNAKGWRCCERTRPGNFLCDRHSGKREAGTGIETKRSPGEAEAASREGREVKKEEKQKTRTIKSLMSSTVPISFP